MKTFTDNAGRTWTVTVNVDAIKRVRDLVDVNLLDVVGGGSGRLLERLTTDPIVLCDVLFALCKPEADTKGISDEDFGRAMGGDALDGATTALLEELVAFFPLARRQVLAKALAKLKALESQALAAVSLRLDDPELEQRLAQQLGLPNSSSGSAPASSASTPGP